jgi:hypothetical protein
MASNIQATRIDQHLLLRFADAQKAILALRVKNALQDTEDHQADFIWVCAKEDLLKVFKNC